LYWAVAALGAKPVARRETGWSEAAYRLPLIVALVVLWLAPRLGVGALTARAIPQSAAVSVIAVILVACGVGFAVWARVHLAGNWSARVTVKQDHQLIRTGPYRYVRHPIYTGMLLALAGTFVFVGTPLALIAFALITVSFARKLMVEERFMTATFGADYDQYRRETARLIPFVW
jgi:protein-S-isoprenylcysteine O-methyltransferase Ste14